MGTWTVGGATLTRIEEQLGFASFPPQQYFAGFEREVLERHLGWLVPDHYAPGQDALITSVHAWLIRTTRHTILLDTCAGNHKDRQWWPRFHQLDTPFLERLEAAGARPEQVDIVLCTHLHADHIGWNTVLREGVWVPTFPNAKYLFSRAESAYWETERDRSDDPAHHIPYRDSVLPVIESGQTVLVDGAHAIDDELLVEPAPGHTPGHVVLHLRSGRQAALLCGDVVHHPIQVCAPHWNTQFCQNPDQARATRRRVLEHCAEHLALLCPSHFGAPHAARIVRQGSGYAPTFVPPTAR
jgi:glyoxylase-like metal-dependent hydrolase (beta-lactamase superfamily II)